ncbi:MAG TPA: hypothetical protein VH040_12630 [Usitatibacter sp.]|jgi:hypothetical protein|nr:hypothetical protein [Usitatibacter sp.]
MISDRLKVACAPCVAALALGLTSSAARAEVAVTVEGPDQLLLVGPSNLSNTNFNRARVVTRDLPPGRLKEIVAPIVAAAVAECGATGIKAISLHASDATDKIGETNTRYGGLGIYANLASNDRNSQGNWFVAPFFLFEGSVMTDSGAAEPIELVSANRIYLQSTDRTTQEEFFGSRTADVEASLKKFVAAGLPQALRTALSSHCGQRRP